MERTEPMNRIDTEVMGGDSPFNTDPVLISPIVFEEYEISTELLRIGGESQVYFATERETGVRCVAKIDTTGLMYKPAERENRVRVVKFLREHTDYKKFHIIPLLASGSIIIQGADGTALPYPVDIYPYCPDGDLERAGKKFSYNELKNKVIPALSMALKTIHENNFIHRDIKPANIYELNGEIVVSDFGTTCVVGSGSIHTERARRTLGYSAPEINSGYAKIESDYFSLGCTLATLYNGKHPYATVLAKETDFAFYELINEKGLVMDYRSGDEPLKYLIESLVRVMLASRADSEGVSLWLSDTKAFYEKYIAGYSSGGSGWKTPFKFEDNDYWNENDLTSAMVSKWTEAKRYLYRGQVINFFKNNQTLQNRVDRIINEPPTATDADLGLAYFLHYLQKGGNIYWCGYEYKDLSEIASHIWKNEKNKNFASQIIKMFQSGYLSWKMNENLQIPDLPKETEEAIKNNLKGVTEIEKLAKTQPNLAYYYAMFQWESGIKHDSISPDELFSSYTKSPKHFYENVSNLINDDFIWAAIASMGFRGQVAAFKNSIGKSERENIEKLYDLFEHICKNKAVVRSHYYECGPDSYLYWLQNNLDMYSFNSKDAKDEKSRIKKIKVSNDMPVSEIRNRFRELGVHFGESGGFMTMFQSDLFIASLGLTKGKDRHGEITATHADAFFIEDFFGRRVPAGFKKIL